MGRIKALAFGVTVTAVVLFGALLAAKPAHATTFTVNSIGDANDLDFPGGTFDGSSDGKCDVSTGTVGDQCTLRAAIQAANISAGADTINFNISDNPGIPGLEVKTITPSSPGLPVITDTVTIDGYTQPGASKNTSDDNPIPEDNAVLKIELNGQNAGGLLGWGLAINASNSVVKGLAINRFPLGIWISGGTGNRIEGDFIGTDPSGASGLGNGTGVIIGGGAGTGFNTIGGLLPETRNVIRDNGRGIVLGEPSRGDKVQNNLIFVNSRSGVEIDSDDNLIGGTEAAVKNYIQGNGSGVTVVNVTFDPPSTGNRIIGNRISDNGTSDDPDIDLGGDGLTPNDPKDGDKGPNTLQNFPVLTSAATTIDSGVHTITGTLNSTPEKRFTIHFYRNTSNTRHGKDFIGQKTVRTNRRGKATFTFTSAPLIAHSGSTWITATATGSGGTSEFCQPVRVVIFL